MELDHQQELGAPRTVVAVGIQDSLERELADELVARKGRVSK